MGEKGKIALAYTNPYLQLSVSLPHIPSSQHHPLEMPCFLTPGAGTVAQGLDKCMPVAFYKMPTQTSPLYSCACLFPRIQAPAYVEGCRLGFSLSGLRILRHRPGAGDHGFQSWLSQQLAV